MEPIDIVTGWKWHPAGNVECFIIKINGGDIPQEIRFGIEKRQWGAPPNLPAGSAASQVATRLVNILANDLPEPQPMNTGGEAIVGSISRLQWMEGKPELTDSRHEHGRSYETLTGQKVVGVPATLVQGSS